MPYLDEAHRASVLLLERETSEPMSISEQGSQTLLQRISG